MSRTLLRRLLPVSAVVGIFVGVAGAPGAVAGVGPEPTAAVIIELTEPGAGARIVAATHGVRVTASVDGLGVVGAEVTARGRAALEESPHVRAVRPPRRFSTSLDSSTPIIGVPALRAAGYTGAGKVVAVIDSGVDVDHPGLAGSVVAEACFVEGAPVGPEDPAV